MSGAGEAPGPARRLWSRLLRGVEAASAVSILVMMGLMTADVFGREALNSPLPGATELIEFSLVVAVFTGLVFVSWRERHITADLFDALLGPRSRLALRAFGCLLGAGIFGLAAPQALRLARRAAEFGDVSATFGLSMTWPLGFMTVMCAICALAFALRALLLVAVIVRGGDLEEGAE
ncbi:TRAP transporter small permease [uncultured Albimonas sp.]|uniref:TRAP transporter small permease n=1 Tax=uncultured Albimonas sp. TaxID=1331701 RepID=UPI0030EEC0A9|tara:strand:- start:6658 stop:7191 length:534 start_codon:yes stop_codon:yes gene_type:complete